MGNRSAVAPEAVAKDLGPGAHEDLLGDRLFATQQQGGFWSHGPLVVLIAMVDACQVCTRG